MNGVDLFYAFCLVGKYQKKNKTCLDSLCKFYKNNCIQFQLINNFKSLVVISSHLALFFLCKILCNV